MSKFTKIKMELTLTLVCERCGSGLEFRNKSAYTDENSFALQVEPCEQCRCNHTCDCITCGLVTSRNKVEQNKNQKSECSCEDCNLPDLSDFCT